MIDLESGKIFSIGRAEKKPWSQRRCLENLLARVASQVETISLPDLKISGSKLFLLAVKYIYIFLFVCSTNICV